MILKSSVQLSFFLSLNYPNADRFFRNWEVSHPSSSKVTVSEQFQRMS